MTRSVTILVTACTLLLLTSCNRHFKDGVFKSHDFEQKTQDHKTVAILPFKMIYTGKTDEQLSKEDVLWQSERESEAFQLSYYKSVLQSTGSDKAHRLRVNIQSINTTMALLDENNISIPDSWNASAPNLAKILGVDAVVRGTITKEKLLDNMTAAGMQAGYQILDRVARQAAGYVPRLSTTARKVHATYTIDDAEAGALLWSVSYDRNVDWKSRSNDIIRSVNDHAAHFFPYR